ncbi:LOW QUALITY PROTEIN: hypothetical protein PHMEG_00015733 [Phytophthora megakarya]|uniref:PiggyBac transposable element-derived protein domain-containing protein n=1 Tax=Phytophthora megakarya TaxID=4795 RepID=A0A225W243_9STRA|nr:LOW QUALITY PROTEIN: hypothetical protein PHMEG_00015733 [Phytophthora megakarya]
MVYLTSVGANDDLTPSASTSATSPPCTPPRPAQPRTPDNVSQPDMQSNVLETDLNSDCEDTETEICFVDDDEEMKRDMRNGNSIDEDEESCNVQDDDGDSDDKASADESDESPDEGQVTFDQENRAVANFRLPRQWDILDKADMNDFARVDSNMQDMREEEWEFGKILRIPYVMKPDFRTQPGIQTCSQASMGRPVDVLSLAHDLLKLFFFFMPFPERCGEGVASNLTARVDRMFEKQKTPGKTTQEQFMNKESKKPDIKPHEVLHVLGLLLARMLNTHRRRFGDHWSRHGVGAVARGTFNEWMSCNLFEHVLALHFTINADVPASTDRAWKLRSVVDIFQKTFPRGYKTPPVISFDKGIIPTRNRKNPTRQYLKAKPHKWDTKVFLTCCADKAYCMSYCGAAQHTAEVGNVPTSQLSADPNTGPSAVIRNLEAVLPPSVEKVFHLVVTDRFYTVVQLAFQLLHRNVYSIGTIQGDKLGYPQEIVEKIEIDLNELPMVQCGWRWRKTVRECVGLCGVIERLFNSWGQTQTEIWKRAART